MGRWVRHGVIAVIAVGILGCASPGLEFNKTGLRYLQEHHPSSAEAEFRQAIAADPSNAMYHNNLGVALSRQHRCDEALVAYRRAAELKPDEALYHVNLGHSYYALGDSESAYRNFRKTIDLAPNQAGAYMTFVRSALDLDRLTESIAYLENLLKTPTPDDPESVNGFFLPRQALAYAHLLQGNPGETRKYASAALEVLGQVKTEKGAYVVPIITPFFYVITMVPPTKFDMTEVYGGFYNLQGMAQFAEADYDDAAKSLEKVRGKSQDYTGYMYLGRVALEKDNPKLALHYFRTVFNMQPTDTARLYLSVALKLSGDEAAGRAHYDQAVNSAKLRRAHAKSHYEYFEALGRAHQAWGCLDEAAAAYTRVIDAVPRLGYGHRQLGEIYWRQGNKSAALSQLREALRLMPQDARTIMLLEEVGE